MKKIMILRRVGATYVVTLPAHMLKKLKWESGDLLDVRLERDEVIVRRESKVERR